MDLILIQHKHCCRTLIRTLNRTITDCWTRRQLSKNFSVVEERQEPSPATIKGAIAALQVKVCLQLWAFLRGQACSETKAPSLSTLFQPAI